MNKYKKKPVVKIRLKDPSKIKVKITDIGADGKEYVIKDEINEPEMKAKAGEFIKTDSGEVIWGSEAFIDEIFKTLYGNKWGETFESYNDALQKIKNLVQQAEVTNEN